MTSASTADLLAAYRSAAHRHGQATDAGNARQCNATHDQIVRLVRELKTRGAEYQEGLLSLLDDDDRHVQVWAASDALAFAPDRAVPVLRRISDGPRGLARLNAQMTLEIWESGEWEPR